MLETVRYGRRGRGGYVSDVLESLGMLHMVGHQAVLLWRSVRVAWRRAVVFVVIVVIVFLAHEVLRPLVLVCAAIVLVAADSLIDIAR